MSNEEKVEFSEAQQAHLDALIGGKFKDLKNENTTLAAEVESLKIELDKRKETATGTDSEDLKAQIKAVVEERRELKILSALTKHEIVDLDAAAKLITDSVYLDNEGRAVGVDSDGQAVLDKSGGVADFDNFVGEFLRERPYLLKGSPRVGSGSHAGVNNFGVDAGSGSSLSRRDFDNLSASERMRFSRNGGKLTD